MSFKRHIATTSGAHLITFGLGFGMSILNARLLGPEGVGVFALLTLLQSLSVRITDFGFGRAFRYYSANREIGYHMLRKTVFQIGFVIGLAVVFVSLALKILPVGIWNDIDWMVYLLFLPTPFLFVSIMFLRHLLHGQLQITAINISEIVERIFYIILFIIFVWFFELGLIGVSLALSISSLLLFLQLLVRSLSYKPSQIRADNPTDTSGLLRKLWSYGQWSYYAGFVEYVILNFPILYLKSSVGSLAQIGYFSKAQGLANYPRGFAVPVSGLLFSYNAGSDNSLANTRTEVACRFSLWIVSFLFFTLALFIKPVISLLYGESFLPAAPIFILLYPSVVFYIQTLFLTADIAAKGFNKETFTIRLRSIPLIVIIAYVLITFWGIKGAAIAISISFTILWIQYVLKYLKLSGSNFKQLIFIQQTDVTLIKGVVKSILYRYFRFGFKSKQ